mgnify:CR=1 FL=1
MDGSDAFVPQAQLTLRRRGLLLFGCSGGLLLLGVLALLLQQQGWFQPQLRVQVVAPTSLGVMVGTPVRLSGLRVGVLERVTLLSDGRVSLSLRISDRYRAWISPRSTARITMDSLLARGAIDLSPAPMPPTRVPDRFTVAYTRSVGLEELIGGAEDTRRELNSLLRVTRRIAAQELPAALRGVQGVMVRSNDLASTIQRELPPTTAELRTTLRSVDQTGRAATRTSDALERSLVALTPELLASLQEFSRLMARSNLLLQGLQGPQPPARSPLGPPASAPLPAAPRP